MNDGFIEENLPLVRAVASRFYGRAEAEDLVQEGSIGLIKAACAFDPSFGTRFSTYAFPVIAGEIRHYLRRSRRARVLLYESLPEETVQAADDTEKEALLRAELAELFSKLDRRERTLLELRFIRGLTQAETARRMGKTQPTVSRAEKRLLEKLRASRTHIN